MDALTRYIRGGYKNVDGWLTAIAVRSTAELGRIQKKLGINGPISEIGVHHGRFFILLHLLTEPPEISAAWDLFEWQHENEDGSGRGDRTAFRHNLLRHGCDLSRIEIRTVNSLNLTADQIISACKGRVRVFSVDGGHTAESTYSDLKVAAESLCEGGIIFLDDFFNCDWPGVAEGTCGFFARHPGVLYPVAILGNKFIFTNAAPLTRVYSQALSDFHRRSDCFVKASRVFGEDTLIFSSYGDSHGRLLDRTLDYSSDTRMWKAVRYTGPGRFLKLVLRHVKDV
ncbi:MAG TPA: class I SAM-dependent methyltransferase [Candidatus Binatia bacterium]